MIGTPHYMSPEQFQGRKVDGRSDLFSLAVMLYEMLTGEKPFTGEQLSTVMTAVIKLDPVEPSELNSMVDDALSTVVMKALSKNPGKRYADGDAFATALRESLKPAPTGEVTQAATDLGATIAIPPVGVDATIATGPPPVEAAPPSPEDTVRGAPPVLEESGAKDAEQEHAVAKPEKKLSAGKVAAGIGVLAILGVAIAMFGGGAPTPENYWAPQGTVEVRLIDTVVQYKAWDASKFQVFPSGAMEPSAAFVKIDADNHRVFDTTVVDGTPQPFDIPEEHQTRGKWNYVAGHSEDYVKEEGAWTRSPKKPGDKLEIKIGLVRKGVKAEAMRDF
jgi:hypothetical protein